METNNLSEILESIEKAEIIGLITHKEGDGDAFGSMLGLARICSDIGKKTVVFSNEPLIPMFDFMSTEINYQPKDSYQPVHLLIALDANGIERFTISEILKEAKNNGVKIIGLDHHQPGDMSENADLYYSLPQKSSTSEIILDLVEKLQLKPDKYTANLLLLGIENDTSSLQNPNTTVETFESVAQLIRYGARLGQVMTGIMSGSTAPSLKLLGLAIKNLKLDEKTGVGITILSEHELKDLGLTGESTSGIANYLDQLKDVRVIVVLEERAEGMIRGSLRSNRSGVDVNEVAKNFGGGGQY